MSIIGHEKQIGILNSLSRRKSIPHAFLFSGPSEVGKRTIALWFLRMINCEKEDSPCGVCGNCREMERGIHPDVVSIAPEEGEIKMKQVEDLIQRVSMRGIRSKFKGGVIDDAHLMNISAQNSFLKTLEEPPGDTILILVTEYPRMLLPTIASRTFQLKFSLVSEKEMSNLAEEVPRFSFGKPGRVRKYLQFPEKREEEEDWRRLMKDNLSHRFSRVKEVAKSEDFEDILRCWLACAREDLRVATKEGSDSDRLQVAIKEMEELLLLKTRTNINKQLALEKIMTKI